jgi:alcohol dehydrogenase (cytochrome c)
MSNRGSDEVVWALSESDGKELWVTRLGQAFVQDVPQSKDGPGCTPTVDGERLYVLGLAGELACLQASDGKILWQRNLTRDFGGRLPMWSYRESPLVDGDQLICTPGGEDATLVALNKRTGETIWKSKVPDSPAPGTAVAAATGPGAAPGAGGPGAGGPGGGGPGGGGPGGRGPGGRGPGGGGPGGFGAPPDMMQMLPVLAALDADGNKELSAEEINAATTALGKLDKNQDGKLVEEELRPAFGGPGGGPRGQGGPQGRPPGGPGDPGGQGGPGGRGGPGGAGGMMRFMPAHAALDANESGEIDAAEMKSAAAALQKLDGNKDGKLTSDEVTPRFGGGGGRRGGAGSGAAYSSPIAIDVGGQRQYVQLTARTLVAVAASDGKVLWRYDRPANGMGLNVSTPLFHDGMVFASTAYGAGGGLVKLSTDGGALKAEEVYFTRRIQNHHGGMVVVDGALYGADGGNEGGYLVCLDFKTGNVLWTQRDADEPQVRKGSVALADGRIYYRVEDGTMLLIEPNPKQYVERGRFKQPDRTRLPAWAHPVIANGKLYVRDQDVLFCYDVKAKQE